MPNEPITSSPPPAQDATDRAHLDQRPDEQQPPQLPEGSVSLAPESPEAYEIPPLNDPGMGGTLAQGAFDVGLSTAEVSIIAEQLAQATPESLTEENCDHELGQLWGSPMEIENRLGTIVEAFAPEIEQYSDLLDSTGLGNSAVVINVLYNAAQRRLGRY